MSLKTSKRGLSRLLLDRQIEAPHSSFTRTLSGARGSTNTCVSSAHSSAEMPSMSTTESAEPGAEVRLVSRAQFSRQVLGGVAAAVVGSGAVGGLGAAVAPALADRCCSIHFCSVSLNNGFCTSIIISSYRGCRYLRLPLLVLRWRHEPPAHQRDRQRVCKSVHACRIPCGESSICAILGRYRCRHDAPKLGDNSRVSQQNGHALQRESCLNSKALSYHEDGLPLVFGEHVVLMLVTRRLELLVHMIYMCSRPQRYAIR